MFSSVQSLSHVQLFATLWTATSQGLLLFTNSWSLGKLMSMELLIPSNHVITCHPLILPSIFPSNRVFFMSKYFKSVGQSIGGSISASVLPMNIQDWFPLAWLGGSPCNARDSQDSCPTQQFRTVNYSSLTILYGATVTSIHDNWKNYSFDYTDLFQQSNVSTYKKKLYRFVIVFLQMCKQLSISWLQSSSAVILEALKIKFLTVSIVSPSIYHEVMGPNAMICIFWMLSLNKVFHCLLSLSSRGSLVPLQFQLWRWCFLHSWGYWYFSQKS